MTSRPQSLATVVLLYDGGPSDEVMPQRIALALRASLMQQLHFPVRVEHVSLRSGSTLSGVIGDSRSAHALCAVPLEPFWSRRAVGLYRTALLAAGDDDVPLLGGWQADGRFARAVAARAGEAMDGGRLDETAVILAARSLPLVGLADDGYADLVQRAAAHLVGVLMPGDWRLAYVQPAGASTADHLEPDGPSAVFQLAHEGWQTALVVPLGYAFDGEATATDLDGALRREVEGAGMSYHRARAVNDSPVFIETLADVVIQHLAQRPMEGHSHS